jgi:nitrite reductase/ring-hydroxylating ferredoxin subunit
VSLVRHFQTRALFDHDQILFEHVRGRPRGWESGCPGAGAAAAGGQVRGIIACIKHMRGSEA